MDPSEPKRFPAGYGVGREMLATLVILFWPSEAQSAGSEHGECA